MWPFNTQQESPTVAPVVGSFSIPNGSAVDTSSEIRPQGWQADAWRLWKMVGELHSPTTYIARVLSRRISYVVDGNDEIASARVLQSALGSTSVGETVRLIALNLQVAGEFWLVQTKDGWDVLAVTTPGLKDIVKKARDAGYEAKRFYDPDPSNLAEADSSFRTILDPAEELVVLSALGRAQSRSRLAQAGVLMVPAEAQFNGDPFGAILEQAMTAAIKDPTSPAAMTPIKIEMAGELIDKVKHVTFDRPFDDHIQEKVDQATKRIALGLDVPPEMLTGLGDMNHWNAWVAQDETYNSVLAPLADTISGVLEFILSVKGTDVDIIPDATELLRTRPETADVIKATEMGAVSLEFLRNAIGALPTDAPTPEDIETLQKVRQSSSPSSPNKEGE